MNRVSTGARPILIASALAAAIGAVMILLSGSNPLTAFAAIVTGSFGPYGWSATMAVAVPVVLCAFAASVPLRAGFVNLGGEGQIVSGGIAAVLVANGFSSLPAPVALPAALLGAAAAGAIVGLIPAVLEVRLGIPLLVSSLLVSYPIVALVSFLVRFPLLDPRTGLPQTHVLSDAYHLVPLVPAAIVALIAAGVILHDRFTPGGYEARMAGLNRAFVAYSGVRVASIALRSMAAGGAIAGVAGALIVMSFPFRLIDGALIAPGYVWTGLLAAMLARSNPIGAIVAAVFFSALQIGGAAMERDTFVPRELSIVLQAVVIIILAGALAISVSKRQKVA